MKLFELKNEELSAKVAAINSGKVIFLGSTDTKNPAIKQGYFAQLRSDVSTSNASSDAMLEMFLGFSNDSSRIVRCVQSYKPAIMKLVEGQVIEGLNIQIEDSMTPFYKKADGTNQEGRKRPNGTAILANGKNIYRKEKLVAGEAKHILITEYDHVSNTDVTASFVETIFSDEA